MELKTIGYLHCSRRYHAEQPAQGVLSDSGGIIELINGYNYEQGLKDLEGFSHIWLLYWFHLNKTWKPLANPPFNDGRGRKGVFATRSPYRPNPIGLSCVKLEGIKGHFIYLAASDLLDGTPILDIKPYIVEYDSFTTASRGWLENVQKPQYIIVYEEQVRQKLNFLQQQGVDLFGIIETQLGFNPLDKTRNKFVNTSSCLLLRFKSWRIEFIIEDLKVYIQNIYSGYKAFDSVLGNDTATDMAVHRAFKQVWQDTQGRPE